MEVYFVSCEFNFHMSVVYRTILVCDGVSTNKGVRPFQTTQKKKILIKQNPSLKTLKNCNVVKCIQFANYEVN